MDKKGVDKFYKSRQTDKKIVDIFLKVDRWTKKL